MKIEDLIPDWKPKQKHLRPSLEEKLFVEQFFRKTRRLTENEKMDWDKEDVKLILELLRYIQNLS